MLNCEKRGDDIISISDLLSLRGVLMSKEKWILESRIYCFRTQRKDKGLKLI